MLSRPLLLPPKLTAAEKAKVPGGKKGRAHDVPGAPPVETYRPHTRAHLPLVNALALAPPSIIDAKRLTPKTNGQLTTANSSNDNNSFNNSLSKTRARDEAHTAAKISFRKGLLPSGSNF